MKLKLKLNKQILENVMLEKDKLYDVEDVIVNEYRIKIPMKQKGKFRYALVKDEEGILVE